MLLETTLPSPSEEDNRAEIKRITEILHDFLNEDSLTKRSRLFNLFIYHIYHNAIQIFKKDPDLKETFTLESIMSKASNKSNLKKACIIIKDAGWGRTGVPWDEQNIFLPTFRQLLDIPVFIPDIYYSPVSSIILLYLLYGENLHFFSGITRQLNIKDIISMDSQEKSDLSKIYFGRPEKKQSGGYTLKIKSTFNISLADFLPLDFDKITKDGSSNELLSLLEAYDFFRHFCLDDSRLKIKGATLFQYIDRNTSSLISHDYDEIGSIYNERNSLIHISRKWIAFRTLLLILAYQNDKGRTEQLNLEIFNFHIFNGIVHMISDMCYGIAQTISNVCILHQRLYERKIKGYELSVFNKYLRYFPHKISNILSSEKFTIGDTKNPSTVKKGQLFHNVLWALETHDLHHSIAYAQAAWDQFDNEKTDGIYVSSDAFFRITLPLIKEKNAKNAPLELPMATDNWSDFHTKYRSKLSAIFRGANKKRLEKIWQKSIITIAFCQRGDFDKIKFKTNIRDFIKSDSKNHSRFASIRIWWSDNADIIRTIPLLWVLEMMIVYVFSGQISVVVKGKDSRYFSKPRNRNDFRRNKSQNQTSKKLQYYIDNIASHYNDELNDIIMAQYRIILMKLMFPPLTKMKWMGFVETLYGNILSLADALRCYVDDKDSSPNAGHKKGIVNALLKIWSALAFFHDAAEDTYIRLPQQYRGFQQYLCLNSSHFPIFSDFSSSYFNNRHILIMDNVIENTTLSSLLVEVPRKGGSQ